MYVVVVSAIEVVDVIRFFKAALTVKFVDNVPISFTFLDTNCHEIKVSNATRVCNDIGTSKDVAVSRILIVYSHEYYPFTIK